MKKQKDHWPRTAHVRTFQIGAFSLVAAYALSVPTGGADGKALGLSEGVEGK